MSAHPSLPGLAAILVTIFALPSCSLKHAFDAEWADSRFDAAVPLQPGVRYEVRKAFTAGQPVRPTEMRSCYFVMQAPHPPLQTATLKSSNRMTVRTTAYCHDEADHLVYGSKNALGTNLKFGSVRSAAADWSRYPVGTRFRIANQPNIIYEVDDYGSALVGTGTIDIYKPSRSLMDAWGVRHVDIEVIQWGSYARSMAIMKDRMKWPHIRHMMADIQSGVYWAAAHAFRSPPITASL